ncbi:MAG: T9SS type A sorting domain-containing protein [Ignavibacteriales bacterium]|nr:T9SS type A sorting domain-containing protein [Ignavibacteriales bacterium]
MKKYLILFIFTANFNSIFSQLDTAICYPLQVGDFWEYQGYDFYTNALETKYRWVVYDTTMANNKNYFAVVRSHKRYIWDRDTIFQRVENNRYVYQYIWYCDTNDYEELFYDFGAKDSSFWDLYCLFDSQNENYFSGVQETLYQYYPLFSIPIQTKLFTNVVIGDFWNEGIIDTQWNTITGWGSIWIARGVGLLEELAELAPNWYLAGAIINNNRYDIITAIKDNHKQNSYNDHEILAYPNPFNPVTNIECYLPDYSFVKLVIYNSIGEKVSEIVNENQFNGKHKVVFDASELSSGLYFYALITDKNRIT